MFRSVAIDLPLWGRTLPELDIVRAVVDSLPPAARAELAGVSLTIRGCTRRLDRARGAVRRQWGYFWGTRPVDDERGETLPSPEGPTGEIVLFRRNYPQRADVLARLLRHEIDHVLGYDEGEAERVEEGTC